ncbi:hypothetical protein ACM66B_007030 [Microbotryomycetes sp. NB124-2]
MLTFDESDFGVVRGKAARVLGEDVLPVPGGKAAVLLGLESPQTSPKSVRVFQYKGKMTDVGASDDDDDDSSEDVDGETEYDDDDQDAETIQDDESIIYLPPPPPRPVKSAGRLPPARPPPPLQRPSPSPRLDTSPLVGLGLPPALPSQPLTKPSNDTKHRRYASGWTVDSEDFNNFHLPSDFYESDQDGQKADRPFSPDSPRMSVLSSTESVGLERTPGSSPTRRVSPLIATSALPPTPPTRETSPLKTRNTITTSLKRIDTNKSAVSFKTRSNKRTEALLALEGNRQLLPLTDSNRLSTSVSETQLVVRDVVRKTRKKPASLKTPSPTKSVWSNGSINKGIGCSFLSYSDSDETGGEEDNKATFELKTPMWRSPATVGHEASLNAMQDSDSEPGSPLDPFFSSPRNSTRRPTTTTLTPETYLHSTRESMYPPSPSLTITSPPRTVESEMNEDEDEETKGLRLSFASWLVPPHEPRGGSSTSASSSKRGDRSSMTSVTSCSSEEDEDEDRTTNEDGRVLMMSFPRPPGGTDTL